MSSRSQARTQRGFTLIELAVSLVAAAIVTAGALALLTQQQRALQTSSADRAIQETVRTSLGEIGATLRRAGFGVEPFRAFDFSLYKCATPVQCRDSIAASDEIVFHARDPGFRVALAGPPGAAQLVIAGGLQTPLYRGQILQVMCPSASEWAYVTVGQRVASNWTPPAVPPATTTIPLTAATGTFPAENGRLTVAGSCFQSQFSEVRVYRVDRFRYYVQSFPDPDAGAVNGRPYLMLDRGLSDDDGVERLEPLAPDVEDLQFEYTFVNATTGVARTVGDVSGTRLSNALASIDLASAPPTYEATTADPSRATNHPANLRAVRLSVVARSPANDITKLGNVVQVMYAEGARLPASANRPVVPGDGGFVRIRVETTEATRNLEARGPYYER
jgi:type IV pilus assembly protein PilW